MLEYERSLTAIWSILHQAHLTMHNYKFIPWCIVTRIPGSFHHRSIKIYYILPLNLAMKTKRPMKGARGQIGRHLLELACGFSGKQLCLRPQCRDSDILYLPPIVTNLSMPNFIMFIPMSFKNYLTPQYCLLHCVPRPTGSATNKRTEIILKGM